MLFAGPQIISRKSPGGLEIPAGLILAYAGTVASIPAGWALCDGTAGTPDLSDITVLGASDVYAEGSSGGGMMSGATSTDGAHTGPTTGGHGSGSGTSNPQTGSAGAHNHTISATAPPPPCYTLAYIMALGSAAEAPTGAVAWSRDGRAHGWTAMPELAGRMIQGVAGDTRTALGSLDLTLAVTTSTAGGHNHQVEGAAQYTPNSVAHSYATAGAHNHTINVLGGRALPPYVALAAIQTAKALSRIAAGVVAPYAGAVAALPAGWQVCDGTNGTPDMRGRIALGADAGHPLLSTGGAVSTTLTGTVTSTVTHNHAAGTSVAAGGYHNSYDWTHAHTWSVEIGLPSYLALNYVMVL